MNRTTILLAVAGLIIGTALGTLALRSTSSTSEDRVEVTGKPLIGGPFSIVDQTGKRVTVKDYRGK
jgi:protein SCO1/2